MNTFLFYDIETTGLNPAFDQILQFSSIRTDLSLNELERHKLKIRLRPDVVPSPGALITNRISIAAARKGVGELAGVARIHHLMNRPGTISLGYNTLGFDDEFMRFGFYRNLLPPYTHQYQDGCGRMDLLPMAVIFWLYRREVLKWPLHAGKPSLKLEHLSAANDLASGPAHDATVDVEATVALARRFLQASKMWHYLMGCFNKKQDDRRISRLPVVMDSRAGRHPMGLMVLSEFGPDQHYQVPVLGLGKSIPYANQSLWLRLDLPQLRETTADTVADTPWVIRKKFGEPGLVLPPAQRYWERLSTQRQDEVQENRRWLKANADLFLEIVRHHREYRYSPIPDLDLDAALYEIGFLSAGDEKLCRRFHRGDLNAKIELVQQFSSAPLREIARRCLGRNYGARLPAKLRHAFERHFERIRSNRSGLDYRGQQRVCPREALAKINTLRAGKTLDDHQRQVLDGLEDYLQQTFITKR